METMDEVTVWAGWLQKRGGDSSGISNRLSFMSNVVAAFKDRYFILTKKTLSYYAPPGNATRSSVFVDTATHKALIAQGFVKKGTVEISDILHMKRSEVDKSLKLVSESGRIYEIAGFDASSVDLSAFEGCLQNVGVKLELEMDSIYGVSFDAPQGFQFNVLLLFVFVFV
jgi:hypothetical protein